MRQSGIAAPMQMVRLVLKDEDVTRIANGHVCLNCQEPFESPYPEKCPVCKYPCRKQQAVDFQAMYQGKEDPVTSLDEHRARFAEEDARAAHTAGSQILVPGKSDSA